MLNRFWGGCSQDNVVGLSPTQFLADVGFKLRECEVHLRRIFSVAGSRRQLVCYRAARKSRNYPRAPKKERPSQNGSTVGNVVRAAALAGDGGEMVAQ